MGLGGGVSCEAFQGYHLREADLYFEVINPDTEKFRRRSIRRNCLYDIDEKGMPLIRYRTGDWEDFFRTHVLVVQY